MAPLSMATTHTWLGQAAALPINPNYDWSASGNWSGGVPPQSLSNTHVILQGTQNNPAQHAPNLNQSWKINKLDLKMKSGTSAPARLIGSGLNIGSGGITNTSDEPQGIENVILVANNQTWETGTANGSADQIIFASFFTIEDTDPNTYTLTLKGTGRSWNSSQHDRGHFLLQGNINGEGTVNIHDNTRFVIKQDPSTQGNYHNIDFHSKNNAELIFHGGQNMFTNSLNLDENSRIIIPLPGTTLKTKHLVGKGTIDGLNINNPPLLHFTPSAGTTQIFQGRLQNIDLHHDGGTELALTEVGAHSDD